jgi:epoxide hydrolase 4
MDSRTIMPLAKAGFRVVAPDQCGYNDSSKPDHWRAYELPRLAGDVLGIADRLEREQFLLAGHDWGGIVAWACAMADEGRIRRLAILNSPHPSVLATQVLRSSYMFFMQLPWLPEFLFTAANFRLMTATLADTSRPGTFFRTGLRELSKGVAAAWSANGNDQLVSCASRRNQTGW